MSIVKQNDKHMKICYKCNRSKTCDKTNQDQDRALVVPIRFIIMRSVILFVFTDEEVVYKISFFLFSIIAIFQSIIES